MKRLSTALTLMTALAAVAAASNQPDEQTQLNLAAVATIQQASDVLDAWTTVAPSSGH